MSTSTLTTLALGAGAAVLGFKALDSRINLTSDIRYIKRLKPMKDEFDARLKSGSQVSDMWYDALERWPDRDAVVFENRALTFRDIETQSNAVANWALSKGFGHGDVVALDMENRPEVIITWLGLTKIGVVISLLNHNLVRKSLLHCIKVCHARAVIFGHEVSELVETVAASLDEAGIGMYCVGGAASFGIPIDEAIAAAPTDAPSPALRKNVKFLDTFGYIYTSGTTGLPKAAVIKHSKMFGFGALFCRTFQVDETDRIYCTLPLYHSAGGGCGVGMMLYGGATLIIKRKFSARAFWSDCQKYNATVVQYIGELCRYLLSAPPSPADRAHRVRIAIGNGLRPDIWAEFQERFGVPQIGEFYGATEGNMALVNHCVTKEDRGAVGRMGWLMKKVMGIKLAKFDIEEEEPVRGPDGFCVECRDGEPGELLAPIKDGDPRTRFEGYTDPKATSKKIITDAFVKGDKYFRTGDLITRDSKGYFYFTDRIGDTFRWHGENVSTTEVAECVSAFPGVSEANVYGVEVPGMDGRACMVAMVADKDTLNLAKFAEHNRANLPSYANPIFLRFLPQIEVTGTFKHLKVQLRKEGIDPAKVTDPVYWLNPDTKAFEPLDAEAYARIAGGNARL